MADWDLTPRKAADSQVELVQLMTLVDANNVGNVHGGSVMKLVDTAAGLAAARHCGGLAVTAALDEMVFLEPVYVNDLVTVMAMVNDSGTTSMEVGVRVEAESVGGHRRVHTSSAYLVYVALDEAGKPRPVPPVVAETAEEQQRQREAKLRRENRLARKAAIQAVRDDER
jgi:acyl-CoA hydrolase